jgi:hypothetical protein
VKWTTWQHIGVDRMGCAWLITRFIDPDATFEFIPYGDAPAETERAFDIPGVRFSHHGGRCSFAALLDAYHLSDPVLARIARIIDEADTVQEVSLEPASAGLDMICRGIRRTSADDQIAVQRGALIYEALYAELAEG